MIKINGKKVTKEDRDISNELLEYLFEDVSIESEFTLGDMFHLLENNKVLLDVYRQNFAKELYNEAKKGPSQTAIEANWRRKTPNEGDLDFIELYETVNINSREKIYNGSDFLQMHAISFPLTKDSEEYYCKEGERINFSVSLTNVRDLLLLPVKIKETVLFIENDHASKKWGKIINEVKKVSWPLGRIFEGLLWEISFHGAPEEQEKTMAHLEMLKDNLDEDLEDDIENKFTNIDDCDIFYELGAKSFDNVFETTDVVSDWVKNKYINKIKELDDNELITQDLLNKLVSDLALAVIIDDAKKMEKFDIEKSLNALKSIKIKENIEGKIKTAIDLRAISNKK